MDGFSKVGIILIVAANLERAIQTSMVGFGRAEVSIPQFWRFSRDPQDGHGYMVVGVKHKSTKWKRKVEKKVEVGRAEVSTGAIDAKFCGLSLGVDPMGQAFLLFALRAPRRGQARGQRPGVLGIRTFPFFD